MIWRDEGESGPRLLSWLVQHAGPSSAVLKCLGWFSGPAVGVGRVLHGLFIICRGGENQMKEPI